MRMNLSGYMKPKLAILWIPILLTVTVRAHAQFSSSGASQVTIDKNGATFDDSSVEPVRAPNSDIIAFRSSATNILVTAPNPNNSDIYTYSPADGYKLMSIAHNGGFSNDTFYVSDSPAISPVLPNGLYGVAFTSTASDLTETSYQDGRSQVYLRIPALNQTIAISRALEGTMAFANADCHDVSITVLPDPDRFLVVFSSSSTSLTPKFTNNPQQFTTVFTATVRIAETGAVVVNMDVASKSVSGPGLNGELDGNVTQPVISGNGNFILMSSNARLVPEIPVEQGQRSYQIFRFNRLKEVASLVSKRADGAPGNSDSKRPSISFSGDTVSFVTTATDLAGVASLNTKRLLVQRASVKGLAQANTARDGTPSNGVADLAHLHPSGKFISFSDTGTNLVDGNTNAKFQTYVKSLVSGEIIRTSETADGAASDEDSGVAPAGVYKGLSLGGEGFNSPVLYSSFQSKSSNLTVSGSNPASIANIFTTELLPPKPKFEKNAPIEAPPDVAFEPTASGASGSKVTFTFQEFEELSASARAYGEVESAAKSRLEYHLEVRKKTGNRRKRFRKSSSNSATIRRLAPGRYVVRYRVVKKSGRDSSTTIESKSRYSPRQTLDIS